MRFEKPLKHANFVPFSELTRLIDKIPLVICICLSAHQSLMGAHLFSPRTVTCYINIQKLIVFGVIDINGKGSSQLVFFVSVQKFSDSFGIPHIGVHVI